MPSERDTRQNNIWGAAGNLKRLHAAALPLVRVARDAPLPLSFAEERLWFLSQSQAASPAYNVPLAWRITGILDVAALQESLKAIIQRHETLRTSFPTIEGQPVAVIASSGDFSLRIEDLGTASDAASEQDVMDRARMEARHPFDLDRGPLLRAVLFGWAPETYLLVLTVHQIVFDGWSILLFNRELAENYRAITEGRPPKLPELSIQYVDFAQWQRTFLQGDVLEDGTSYWSNALCVGYAPLRLPGSSPTAPHTGPAVKRPWALPKDLTTALKRFAQTEHATEFMVFVSALQALLHAYTHSEDIIVFASCAARNRPELRDMIGLVANVLPLRIDLAGNPSFRELLQRVRGVILDAFAHQELPFARIIEFLTPIGNHRHDSLFQVMVVYQNAPVSAQILPHLTLSPVDDIDNGAARFPLLFDIADTKDGLRGSVKYRPDILPETTADRLLKDFRFALETVLANPNTPIAALQISPAQTSDPGVPLDAAPSRPNEPAAFVAPRDTLERQLVNVWEDLLQTSPVGVRDNFLDLGGDSFAAVRLLLEVEALTGRRLPLVTLLEAPTIEQLAAILRNDGWTPRWSSLVPIRPGGSRPPFYCFHGVGGNILEFEQIGRYLNPDQPLYGLQAQGLDGRSPRHKTVEEMATHYVTEIRELQPRGPYYLGGSSFGGMVAYQAAQQLLALGETVGALVLFDTHAPGFPKYLPSTTAFRKTFGRLRFRLGLHVSNILASTHGQKWEYVQTKAVRLKNQIHAKARRRYRNLADHFALPRNIRDVQKAGASANRTYLPKPYPAKMTLLRATEQPYDIYPDRTNGWSDLAIGGLEILDIPGHHGSIMRQPRVPILARTLDACLEKAQAREHANVSAASETAARQRPA